MSILLRKRRTPILINIILSNLDRNSLQGRLKRVARAYEDEDGMSGSEMIQRFSPFARRYAIFVT